jgi:hypothetical protein
VSSVRTYLRCALSVLTGLWVTIGAAVPIGYVILRVLESVHGTLGPELLGRPGVVMPLMAGYALAATIGGWAAAWVTIERRRRLTLLLSVSHVGTWLVVLWVGAGPLPTGIILGLAMAAVAGTIVGVALRVWQVDRSSGTPHAERGPEQ